MDEWAEERSTFTEHLRRRAIATGLAAVLTAGSTQATMVEEQSWHPVAGAYLSSVYFLNLEPVDWGLIARTYEGAAAESGGGQRPFDVLAQVSAFSGEDHVAALRAAIAAADRAPFYGTATRATSQTLRLYLDRAAMKLAQPGAALDDVRYARSIYRAFAGFIRQADPDAHTRMGLAWLDLASSTGHVGVAGIGATPTEAATFRAARARIESYMITHYEDTAFAPRARFDPVPGQVRGRGGLLAVEPWLPPGSDLGNQHPLPRLVLNFEQQGIDERDLFPVVFGDMLFDSPEIFGPTAANLGIACSTCHNRGDINRRFMIPGLSPHPGAVDVDGSFFNARFNDHRADPIDIPSLRGIRLTPPYGRDGRTACLRDFTRNVIVNEFGGAEPTPLMLDALIAYMNEIDFLPPRYLRPNGMLNQDAPMAARRGAALFRRPFTRMDGQSCADCHIPSASFRDGRSHDIGSGGGAYDTPTLLNVRYTAPYFHDGGLATLGQVVDWFDANFDLELSNRERADLTAYLDAVGTTKEPYERFDDRFTPFRLTFEELSTFLAGLDYLLPDRDGFHADLLLRTVAKDLRADAADMTAVRHRDKVFELAARLEELRAVIGEARWRDAESLWTAYQTLEAQYDPYLR